VWQSSLSSREVGRQARLFANPRSEPWHFAGALLASTTLTASSVRLRLFCTASDTRRCSEVNRPWCRTNFVMTRDCIIGWRRIPRPTWLLRDASGHFTRHEIRVRHEFSDGEAMVAAVLAGCGLCQLPTWLIADHLSAGRLIPVLDEFAGAEMPIHAIWPRSRYMQPKLRVVIDALAQLAATEGSGFNP